MSRERKKRIVLKFGTGILTRHRGSGIDSGQVKRLAKEVAALVKAGNECLIVSSGAVAAGMMVLGLTQRPQDLTSRQACAAIGQSHLMRAYEAHFARHKLHVAQLLLTHQDMDSRTRYQNAKNTIERLLEQKNVIPIINENDTVAVEELRYGDNDRLSAEVAILAGADLLVMLTSVEGLLQRRGERMVVVPRVSDVDSVLSLVHSEVGKHSVGGMATKLQAAKAALAAGIPAVIGSGRIAGVMDRAVNGGRAGTRFPAG